MEENPYKAPAEVDADRNGIVRFFSRFQVQYWCWITAIIVSPIVLAFFYAVFLAKGLPAAFLKSYFLDATYALLGLWAVAGFILKGCWFVILRRKHRAHRLRIQRLNSGINPRLNIAYMEMLQKHFKRKRNF